MAYYGKLNWIMDLNSGTAPTAAGSAAPRKGLEFLKIQWVPIKLIPKLTHHTLERRVCCAALCPGELGTCLKGHPVPQLPTPSGWMLRHSPGTGKKMLTQLILNPSQHLCLQGVPQGGGATQETRVIPFPHSSDCMLDLVVS